MEQLSNRLKKILSTWYYKEDAQRVPRVLRVTRKESLKSRRVAKVMERVKVEVIVKEEKEATPDKAKAVKELQEAEKVQRRMKALMTSLAVAANLSFPRKERQRKKSLVKLMVLRLDLWRKPARKGMLESWLTMFSESQKFKMSLVLSVKTPLRLWLQSSSLDHTKQ